MYFFLFILSLIVLLITKLGRDRTQWYGMNILMRIGGIWYGFRPPKHILPPEVTPPKTIPSGAYITFDRTLRLISNILEKPSQPPNLTKIRASFDSFAFGLEKDIKSEVRTTTRWEEGKEVTVKMELLTPPTVSSSSRLIFFSHGGGLYAGAGLGTHRHCLGELARLTQTRVIAVDYHVIPESRYDSPLNDVIAAWDYVINTEIGMGIKPQEIVVAGESAGGTLTSLLVTSLQRRTQYQSTSNLPHAVILMSTFDFSMNETNSRQTNGIRYKTSQAYSDPLVTTHILKWNTNLLSSCGAPDNSGNFYSPLYQATQDVEKYHLQHPYQHFPPTLIQCGRYESLIDDSEKILAAMQKAGVNVVHSFPDWYIHMQSLFTGLYPEATASLQELADFINTQLKQK